MPDLDVARPGDWIDTAGGPFWLLDPRPSDISLDVIAHALSNVCRFGGHTTRFYSVAQHSVLCSRMAPPDLKLQALLHDAAEAYVGDMVRPLKRDMGKYRAVEDAIMAAVAEHFGIPAHLDPVVKHIDERMLVTEASQLMAGRSGDWWRAPGYLPPFEIDIDPWPPQRAKQRFLVEFVVAGGHQP